MVNGNDPLLTKRDLHEAENRIVFKIALIGIFAIAVLVIVLASK